MYQFEEKILTDRLPYILTQINRHLKEGWAVKPNTIVLHGNDPTYLSMVCVVIRERTTDTEV